MNVNNLLGRGASYVAKSIISQELDTYHTELWSFASMVSELEDEDEAHLITLLGSIGDTLAKFPIEQDFCEIVCSIANVLQTQYKPNVNKQMLEIELEKTLQLIEKWIEKNC